MSANIAVIIPAFRAEWCIADAVASALAQPEVAEVFVVDDASGDCTLKVAGEADDGSGRLKLLRQEANQGPSAARNRAIAESSSPILALLDADDMFLPGRFAALRAIDEPWDFLADDMIFAEEKEAFERSSGAGSGRAPRTRQIGLAEFARRNISKRGLGRSELGFLKPIMKREFLDRFHLRYHENMRLGEDFILYCEALARGAKFLIADTCGYGAIERAGSLSGRHSADDLAALANGSRSVMSCLPDGLAREMLNKHAAAIDIKVAHRRFLDRKRGDGFASALGQLCAQPHTFFGVAAAIAYDKFAPAQPLPLPRRLFSREEFEFA